MADISKPFNASREALDWADDKITDSDILLRAHFEANPYEILVQRNSRGLGGFDYLLRLQNPIPREINQRLGEAIQYLRSALDYAICDVVEPISPTLVRRMMFPIVTDLEAFENQLRRLKIPAVSQELEQFLRLKKPYGGGNDDLFFLNELNRSGKHRQPVAIGSAGAAMINGKIEGFIIQMNFPAVGNPEKGIVLVTLSTPDYKFDHEVNASFDVAFANIAKIGRKPCVRLLRNYHSVVKGVVDDMESTFSPR